MEKNAREIASILQIALTVVTVAAAVAVRVGVGVSTLSATFIVNHFSRAAVAAVAVL